jgi:hypothetical protein
MRWARHVAQTGCKKNAFRVLVGKPEAKRQLERPRRRWREYIEIDITELGMDWICLAQGRGQWMALVDAVMNLLFP